MKILEVSGGHKLSGTIRISGAKNSSVALIPAAILADEPVTICNIPEITDTDSLTEILKYLKTTVKRTSESIIIDGKTIVNTLIPKEISNKLRASYYFMGALLGKYKKVEIYFPGGCSIGARPINLHLKGFEALGAKIVEKENLFTITAKELKGANIYLDFASVGATINIMLAAVLATGLTQIENAAKEPEIVNIATMLNSMGAKITGVGTSTINIEGVLKLHGCFHEVIPDRIEAGTYTILGALVGQNLKIDNIIPEHLEALSSKLIEMGVDIEIGADYFIINSSKDYKTINIKTQVFPGFPTDLQQPMTVLLTKCRGNSTLQETIYENRFMHISYLNNMGANIIANKDKIIIKGPTEYKGTTVKATDLRAGAALVLAALTTDSKTVIENSEHILRGYEQIIEKLTNVGAKIEIKEI